MNTRTLSGTQIPLKGNRGTASQSREVPKTWSWYENQFPKAEGAMRWQRQTNSGWRDTQFAVYQGLTERSTARAAVRQEDMALVQEEGVDMPGDAGGGARLAR